MKSFCFMLLFILAAALLTPAAGPAQTSFGKNKIQYSSFDWHYIQTTHFDLYFDKGTENLATFAAHAAESAYVSISHDFRYRITQRIPFIIYKSHNTFQQTNVVSSYLEEGIGGVTELFKNRVVVPFEGDYAKFRHVIHHELVHAVINDMFYGGSIQSIIANNITLQLPLWFNEGLAEYEALKWDKNSDMFIRDATLHGYLPPIRQLSGYFAYRGGQSVWNYIATKYGEQEIGEILTRIRGTRSVDNGFRGAIGMDVTELSEKWTREQKVIYWPDIAKRDYPADYATALTDHRKEGGFYNTSPAISPTGDRVAFISNRNEFFDVYITRTDDRKSVHRLISGQQTADFEELHLLTPGMSWSPDGRHIALAVKSGDRDAIILVDVENGDEQKLEFDLDGIFSVDWSPSLSGNRLAFIGIKEGQSDVFVYDFESGALYNITDDIFTDADPVWASDGKSVFFASDRGDYLNGRELPDDFTLLNFDYGQMDLYRADAATGATTRITDMPNSAESSPAATPDGNHLLFISDVNGINNIYVRDLGTGETRPITNSISGVYQLSLSRNGEKLVFSSLHNAGFDLFFLRQPLDRVLDMVELEKTEFVASLYDTSTGPAPAIRSDTVSIGDDLVLKTSTERITRRETGSGLNLRNYIFRRDSPDTLAFEADSAAIPEITGNVDDQGNFLVNKYRLNFSPDIIYGNAGYNTFYGVEGSTIMAFSDMLGDHQIFLITNLLFDLKNSDYALAYLYLPKRIDYGIQASHSARAVILQDPELGETLNRFRNYGVGLFALYPVTKFTRYDFGLSWLNVTRENLDRVDLPTDRSMVILPSIGYVHDTSLWGLIAPANGRRFSISVMASPKISDDSPAFYGFKADYRTYYRLGQYYTFALRLAGGGSFGENPQRFILGGVDNWINGRFEDNTFPITTADDYLFLTTGIPLRGYNYNARNGTKYALVNMELRFPLFGYLTAGPLPVFFQTLTGTLFMDVGATWTRGRDVKLVTRNASGNTVTRDLLPGMGYGIRMVFLGFLVKMDVGWAFDLQHFSRPQYYFSLGADI